jgi:hypothetical protein
MNKEMEEKIYQKINEGLGKTALSERTIRSKAARLAAKIKTDEELTEDVLSDAVEDLRVLAGQLDHDVAEKVKIEAERKAAELVKSRNKQEKPEEPNGKTITEDESPPSWFLSYKEQQEKLWSEKLSEVEKEAKAFSEHQKREKLNQFLRSEAKRLGVPESHLVGMKPVESEDEAREILAAKKEAIVKEGIGSQGVGASEGKKDRDPFAEIAKAETEKLASDSKK